MSNFNLNNKPLNQSELIQWCAAAIPILFGRTSSGSGGSSSLTIGATITGGTNNTVLYQDGSGNLGEITTASNGFLAISATGLAPSVIAPVTGSATISIAPPIGLGSYTVSIPSSVALPGSPTTSTQSASDNSTKIATTAYVDRVGTGTAGGDLTGTYPNPTLDQTIAHTWIPSSGTTFNIQNLGATVPSPAIIISNTTAATNTVNQVSPALRWLGTTFGASSSVTGFRAFSSGVSAARSVFYPVFNIDSTVDGTTFINVLKLYSVASAQAATLAIPLTVTGGIVSSININAGTSVSSGTGVSVGTTITNYNGLATAGLGVPAIYSSSRTVGATAAVSSVATYTVGASDGSFEVSANVLVTTSTTFAFTVTCAYTSEDNTARVMTFPFNSLAGTFLTSIANTGGTVPYESPVMHIRCKAGTAITIASAAGGTYTAVVYNIEGIIKQMA